MYFFFPTYRMICSTIDNIIHDYKLNHNKSRQRKGCHHFHHRECIEGSSSKLFVIWLFFHIPKHNFFGIFGLAVMVTFVLCMSNRQNHFSSSHNPCGLMKSKPSNMWRHAFGQPWFWMLENGVNCFWHGKVTL